MSRCSLRFRGSIDQLRAFIAETGFEGDWEIIPHGWCYRCRSGALLNWWFTTGTINFQGPPERASALEAALIAGRSGRKAPIQLSSTQIPEQN